MFVPVTPSMKILWRNTDRYLKCKLSRTLTRGPYRNLIILSPSLFSHLHENNLKETQCMSE
jgi:hypothetical protein